MATEYKKVPRRDTYDSHSSDDPPVTVPFSFPSLFSAFVSVLVRSGLGFIVLLQSSCLRRFMLGQSCAPVLSFCSASLLPVFYNGRERGR